MASGYRIAKHLHVAIALAVLSHKPPKQSLTCSCFAMLLQYTFLNPDLKCAAYLIDLKTWFPLASTESNHMVGHNFQRVPDDDDPWRKRVLELEEENELLKLRSQKQELEVLVLKSAPAPLNNLNTDARSSQPPKKKRKTGPNALSDRLDLRSLVNDLRLGPGLPVLKDSLDVLTSFRILQQSDSDCMNSKTDEIILIPNIKRSLVALGNLITAVLAPKKSVIATSSRIDVASCLCNLLLALLRSTLPLRPPHSILPHIQGELAMCIVRPIIGGFHGISVYKMTSGVKEPRRKSAAPDVRPDLLSVIKRLIECLRTLKERTRELREFVIFETVKEIERLWNIEKRESPATLKHTGERRIKKLARKDSLWYHCSVLHVALDQLPPSTTNHAGDSLLSSAAVQALASLIQSFDSQTPVDVVARGMMLGVVEKAWLSELHGPTEGEESIWQ